MLLKDLNTEDFIYNPKGRDFQKNIEKRPAFQFNVDKVHKKKILTYITLMYDRNSELRKIEKEYGRRKKIAAVMSGFNLHEDGRFYKGVEDILLGNNKRVNKAIVEYLFMSFDIHFISFALHEHMLYKLEDKIYSKPSKDDEIRLARIKKALLEEEEILFGGHEVLNMRRALYEGGRSYMEEKYQQEDVVDKHEKDGLKDWNPYGENYEVGEVKFAGEQIPEE